MINNALISIQGEKAKLIQVVKQAHSNGWINDDAYTQYKYKIDQDIITIGVIGQMKAGKSTFLNAFIFGDNILPVADTTETAAISVITYGEQKSISVEYFTKSEWDDIVILASAEISDNTDEDEKRRITAARQMKTSADLVKDKDIKLGTSEKVSLNSLRDYVGKKGKYTCITKCVNISYPAEWLKGVRIVDTPGTNDPVASREERTRNFLREADAVLLLTPSMTIMDSADSSLIFDMVGCAGSGKVLVGLSLYDYVANTETASTTRERGVKAIQKACNKHADSNIVNLLKDVEPYPFSGLMALLGRMPYNMIMGDNRLSEEYSKFIKQFNILNQKDLVEKSLISKLEQAIVETALKAKEEILFSKIKSALKQGAQQSLKQSEDELKQIKFKIEHAYHSDEENTISLKYLQMFNKKVEVNKKMTKAAIGKEMDHDISKGLSEICFSVNNFKIECENIIKNDKKKNRIWRCHERCNNLLSEELSGIQNKTDQTLYDTCEKKAKAFMDNMIFIVQKQDLYLEGVNISDIRDEIIAELGQYRPSPITRITDENWMYYDKTDINKYFNDNISKKRDVLYQQLSAFCRLVKDNGISDKVSMKKSEYMNYFDIMTETHFINKLTMTLNELLQNETDRVVLIKDLEHQKNETEISYKKNKQLIEEFFTQLTIL